MIWYVSVKPSFAFYVGNKHKYYEVDKRFAALLDATTHISMCRRILCGSR
jgi:hypothetical protein